MNTNPFIENSPVTFLREISKDILIKGYKRNYKIDIDNYLAPAEKISLYECKESGYQFFFPFNISGDSQFYEKLQNFDWYYMPWKWEHELCKKFIKENDKILEVGCGRGAFLNKISEQYNHIDCIGLELNKSAVVENDKYQIINADIADYSSVNEGQFDVVCSFEVLEHVSMVRDFLAAKIRCIKKEGLLIIAVPNNDSFIKYNKYDLLNMPPHHVGLWTEQSLKKIGEQFNLDLVEVAYEPLPEYHYYYYTFTMLQRFIGDFPARIVLKVLKMFKLTGIYNKRLKRKAKNIKGHTILIVFRKKD